MQPNKTTPEQRAELLSYGNYLAGCSGDGELIIKALDDLAEAELRIATALETIYLLDIFQQDEEARKANIDGLRAILEGK